MRTTNEIGNALAFCSFTFYNLHTVFALMEDKYNNTKIGIYMFIFTAMLIECTLYVCFL